jgi:prepilin-type N-terminal cleavage/methylation domain-containing protein
MTPHTVAARRIGRRNSARRQEGFTLIEVLIAISLLAGVVLTMAMSTTISARNVRTSGARSRAQALVDQQISRARTWPTYSTLNVLSGATYNPTANGLSLATTTAVDSTTGKNVTTVSVTASGTTAAILATPIVRTISIAAP